MSAILLLAQITDAQLKVFRYLYEAFSRDDIAKAIGISRDTVDSHIKAIYKKAGVHSAGQLQKLCRELNIKLEDLIPKPKLD